MGSVSALTLPTVVRALWFSSGGRVELPKTSLWCLTDNSGNVTLIDIVFPRYHSFMYYHFVIY